jgi:hypothetical protein
MLLGDIANIFGISKMYKYLSNIIKTLCIGSHLALFFWIKDIPLSLEDDLRLPNPSRLLARRPRLPSPRLPLAPISILLAEAAPASSSCSRRIRSPVSILIHPIRPRPRPRISSPRPPLCAESPSCEQRWRPASEYFAPSSYPVSSLCGPCASPLAGRPRSVGCLGLRSHSHRHPRNR